MEVVGGNWKLREVRTLNNEAKVVDDNDSINYKVKIKHWGYCLMNETDKVIGIASDHGGFNLKEQITDFLKKDNYQVIDYGTNNGDSVDYPDYAYKIVMGILNSEVGRGIIMCGTGIGISITANRFPGIRAALCWDEYSAKMSKEHNNANILAFGGRTTDFETAKKIVSIWLNTPFEGGRHLKRIEKIDDLAIDFWSKYLKNKEGV